MGSQAGDLGRAAAAVEGGTGASGAVRAMQLLGGALTGRECRCDALQAVT